MRQRLTVGDVGREQALRRQQPLRRSRELRGGQIGRCSSCGEDVGDDRVKRSGTQLSQGTAGIGHSDSYPGPAGGLTERQPPADELYERGVGVYGELA